MNFKRLLFLAGCVSAPECTENQKFFGSQVAFVVAELQHLAPPTGGLKDAVAALWRSLIHLWVFAVHHLFGSCKKGAKNSQKTNPYLPKTGRPWSFILNLGWNESSGKVFKWSGPEDIYVDTFIFFVAQFKYERFSKRGFFKLHTYSRLDGATSLEVRRDLRKQNFFFEDGRASSYLAGPLFLFFPKICFIIWKRTFRLTCG